MKQIIEALEKSSEFFGDPKEGDNEYLWTLCNEAIKRIEVMRSEKAESTTAELIGVDFEEMSATFSIPESFVAVSGKYEIKKVGL